MKNRIKPNSKIETEEDPKTENSKSKIGIENLPKNETKNQENKPLKNLKKEPSEILFISYNFSYH